MARTWGKGKTKKRKEKEKGEVKVVVDKIYGRLI